jgi:3-oxoacid CoA-transferase subunit B
MEHTNKYNESKIKKNCTLPLTGQKVVHRLITDLAVFDFTSEGMILKEIQEGVTLDEVIEKTEASFTISTHLMNDKNDRQKAPSLV